MLEVDERSGLSSAFLPLENVSCRVTRVVSPASTGTPQKSLYLGLGRDCASTLVHTQRYFSLGALYKSKAIARGSSSGRVPLASRTPGNKYR